ncbi:sodium:proline symporter [Putridiphycobacter roseus]|uniref:histidine kinase n=1 Tax=Putridiphycobacter roseus TaxID=2219161 RepID=A0A2W1NSE8_9FLAO|nr:ATP-binding protein [Putridiphycobacter roseus]PZE17598.1 sodium:proline symporter [Putridiphycobacter roseus]
MSNLLLVSIIILYLVILFGIAYLAEKKSKSKWVNNPYIYTLSLAVYCSAWTYYGSVGVAAKSGFDFLPIYLGPVIAFPLWIVLMRKIIRISKQHKVSSIADFISLRYANNRFLGALITLICVVGTVPYIALQLKAISDSFGIMTTQSNVDVTNVLSDHTFYIAILLGIFATFFGTQKTDASENHKGIIASVAFESILKLIFFLIIGIYVTFYLFNGTEDILSQIAQKENFSSLTNFNGLEDGMNWFFMIFLSFMAIFLLPRQFQVSVVENSREKHLKKAIWLFPLYLLLFNLFVIYIAWGGTIKLGDSGNPDYYALLMPLQNGDTFLALLVFLGGFSAVISMVVVSTLALSTMVSNNLIIPYGFLEQFVKGRTEKNDFYIKAIRRVSIFMIIMAAYLFYITFSVESSLISIGLISFVVIAQLGPSFFIGLFWNRGSSNGAIWGIIIGFCVTFYTLILPLIMHLYFVDDQFIDQGPLGIEMLKPHALFGIDFLNPHAHAFFWSMFFNLFTYLIVSISQKGNYRERNYAEMFVDSQNFNDLQDNALVWKGEAYVADIRNVLIKFLGNERTERALSLFFQKYDLPQDTQMADARLINFSEKLLTGSIGGSSAKILISSVVKEEEISLVEVLKILEESKENITNNKLLTQESTALAKMTEKLQQMNDELIKKDHQKDEFLDTVSHELKTPVTGIRAATELLIDDSEDMPTEIKDKFLKNILNDSERLSRLINHILDFEKIANGRVDFNQKKHDFNTSLTTSISSINQIAIKYNIKIKRLSFQSVIAQYDEDRILQVLTNLLSNAIKFCKPDQGVITISYEVVSTHLLVYIHNNGKAIPAEDKAYIFDKFYQSKNQNTVKPLGSGLGLAISKQIILKHNGEIWVKNENKNGVTFGFQLPIG